MKIWFALSANLKIIFPGCQYHRGMVRNSGCLVFGRVFFPSVVVRENEFTMKNFVSFTRNSMTKYLFAITLLAVAGCRHYDDPPAPDPTPDPSARYTMPEESQPHEGTWLQWPHDNQYGAGFRDRMEPAWIEMTRHLQAGERVHIVAYDDAEQAHIKAVLAEAGVPKNNINYFNVPTNDFWMRDNGPIFVYDEQDQLRITDWGFNGWGFDAPFKKDNAVPERLASLIGMPAIDLNAIVLEGGAIEVDGQGTLVATRSSVTHRSRNPRLSEKEMEAYLTTYLGITNFIWLDGTYGEEITDNHIDGVMKFIGNNTILTMNDDGLSYNGLSRSDISKLYSATNARGEAYRFDYLPMTANNVTTTQGKDLGYKGSYVNFYIANQVVLVPVYQDPNDRMALDIIQNHFPSRQVVGIDARDMYELGGMIHCVTQQQPEFRAPSK